MRSKAKPRRVTQPKDRRNREPELLEAALHLFARQGYAATGLQDIADAVGVLKGSLYHYITTKEDLLYEIFERAHVAAVELMAETDALDMDPVERLRTYLEHSVLNRISNLELTTLYFRDWRQLTGDNLKTLIVRRRQYDAYLRRLIAEAREAAGVADAVDARYASSFIWGGTSWVADWYHPEGRDAPEEVARGYTDLAMAAILGHASAPADARPGRRVQA